MSWTLNLDFLGLTALMPLDGSRWLVALPDLKNGSDLAGLPSRIDSHQSLVAVPPLNVHQDSLAQARLQTSSDGGDWHFFELDRHFLHLGQGGTAVAPIADGSEHDLSSVPTIGEIVPAAADFDGSLLSDWFGEQIAPNPGVARLAATVLLDRGRLGARQLLVEDTATAGQVPSQFEFRASLADPPVLSSRPMADGFRLAVEVEEDTATLFLGNRDGDEVELIVTPNGGPEVTVRIHNEELEDILGFEIEVGDPSLGDVDFAIFYTLSTGWPGLSASGLPVPFRISTGGGGKNRPCRSPQYRSISF